MQMISSNMYLILIQSPEFMDNLGVRQKIGHFSFIKIDTHHFGHLK